MTFGAVFTTGHSILFALQFVNVKEGSTNTTFRNEIDSSSFYCVLQKLFGVGGFGRIKRVRNRNFHLTHNQPEIYILVGDNHSVQDI